MIEKLCATRLYTFVVVNSVVVLLGLSSAAAARDEPAAARPSPKISMSSFVTTDEIQLGDRLVMEGQWRSSAGEYQPFIIGGTTAQPGEFPWMVMLVNNGENKVRCSGALIRDVWVLTAAHCLNYIGVGDDAYIGIVSATSTGWEKREIVGGVRHSDPETNDVLLLKLDTPSTLAVLPLETTAVPVPSDATILGFGKDEQLQDGVLKYAKTEIVSWQTCGSVGSPEKLCAADTNGGICWGDSGGPLVTESSGQWRLVGVASRLDPTIICGTNSSGLRIGVFAKGSSYIDWINGEVGS